MNGTDGTSGLEKSNIGFGRKYYKPSPKQPSLLSKVLKDLANTTFSTRDPDEFPGSESLLRLVPSAYADGFNEPSGADRPSARLISNVVFDQPGNVSISNPLQCTDLFWLWGQFIDHDIDLTPGEDPAESFPITVPTGDEYFDPTSTGTVEMPLDRSQKVDGTGVSGTPREQTSVITSFIDCSNVYGSTAARNTWLRSFSGGRLKMSEGDMLPLNDGSMENAGPIGLNPFVAGDVRANENTGLMSLHALFARNHNWWANKLEKKHPSLNDEQLYQKARVMNESEVQGITFKEFLPLLLGGDEIPEYAGYDDGVNTQVANEFSTAAYRLGHSLLSEMLWRVDKNDQEIPLGHLTLRDAFFAPDHFANDGGIDYVLRGAAKHVCQKIDTKVVQSIRNFLFGEPGSGGHDLASLNIQRGRDHGIPDYNSVRVGLGLSVKTSFSEISSDSAVATALSAAYDADIDKIDLWVGGLAEDPTSGSQLGETFHKIVRDQFLRLRDGDPMWYENRLTENQLEHINKTTLKDVVIRNTHIKNLQEYVMKN